MRSCSAHHLRGYRLVRTTKNVCPLPCARIRLHDRCRWLSPHQCHCLRHIVAVRVGQLVSPASSCAQHGTFSVATRRWFSCFSMSLSSVGRSTCQAHASRVIALYPEQQHGPVACWRHVSASHTDARNLWQAPRIRLDKTSDSGTTNAAGQWYSPVCSRQKLHVGHRECGLRRVVSA
jgi:hypothetical protein